MRRAAWLAIACAIAFGCKYEVHVATSGAGTSDVPLDGGMRTPPWVEIDADGEREISLATYGDLDADGRDDLILVNRRNSDEFGTPYRAGSVAVIYGRAARLPETFSLADADAEIIGPTHQTTEITATTADLDGDGFDDIVIGVTGIDGGLVVEPGDRRGTLHVVYGGPARLSGRPFVESVSASFVGGARFGSYVRSAGDLDGDGRDEVLVGDGSAIHALRGRAARFTHAGEAPFVADSSFAFDGETAFVGVGTAGDLDGDGALDLVVGDLLGTSVGQSLRASIFYGPIAWGAHRVTDADAQVLAPRGEWYGLRSGFDLDGDGRDELALATGHPGDSTVYVVRGGATRIEGTRNVADVAATRITGLVSGDRVGADVTAGDADGDGLDDLVLGSPNFTSGADASLQVGRVYRVYGPGGSGSIGAADEVWEGRTFFSSARGEMPEGLGFGVAMNGDFDGDGLDDLAMPPGALACAWPEAGCVTRLVFGASR